MNKVLPDLLNTPRRDYPKERKNPIRLNNKEKWAIAKFCLENRNILQDPTKANLSYIWRVNAIHTAKEINLNSERIVARTINDHHVRDAVNFYIEICQLTDKMPQIPAETVEMDRLGVEIARKENEILNFKHQIGLQSDTIVRLVERIGKIRHLADLTDFK